eukprot:scpid82556/ scgid31729/ 
MCSTHTQSDNAESADLPSQAYQYFTYALLEHTIQCSNALLQSSMGTAQRQNLESVKMRTSLINPSTRAWPARALSSLTSVNKESPLLSCRKFLRKPYSHNGIVPNITKLPGPPIASSFQLVYQYSSACRSPDIHRTSP